MRGRIDLVLPSGLPSIYVEQGGHGATSPEQTAEGVFHCQNRIIRYMRLYSTGVAMENRLFLQRHIDACAAFLRPKWATG